MRTESGSHQSHSGGERVGAIVSSSVANCNLGSDTRLRIFFSSSGLLRWSSLLDGPNVVRADTGHGMVALFFTEPLYMLIGR
ncbi:MAG: hypothetical protein Ct9H300mP32_5550 [Verrucomicrobiota bacterium]|nr:MAG: hypothetical protein Ct9H300mP32_5550 [Verrucomicrobiota bacterium]